jgi:hypothetical protein
VKFNTAVAENQTIQTKLDETNKIIQDKEEELKSFNQTTATQAKIIRDLDNQLKTQQNALQQTMSEQNRFKKLTEDIVTKSLELEKELASKLDITEGNDQKDEKETVKNAVLKCQICGMYPYIHWY